MRDIYIIRVKYGESNYPWNFVRPIYYSANDWIHLKFTGKEGDINKKPERSSNETPAATERNLNPYSISPKKTKPP